MIITSSKIHFYIISNNRNRRNSDVCNYAFD
jgi:hypothetical protein